jgi:uncharacterized protein YfaP (DUF2135 family)
MAEATSKVFTQALPNAGVKMIYATCTVGAGGADTLTVTGINTITNVLACTTDGGAAGTYTITGGSNVVTITSAAGNYRVVVLGYY